MVYLLKLGKSFPLCDKMNNTVLGILVCGRISEETIEKFWNTVQNEIPRSDIGINMKNDLGETLLHIAARQSEIAMVKHLSAILSTFENLSQFENDMEGRNFLHIIYDNHFTDRDGKYSDFISRLMQGRFPYCSKSIVKSMINSQDKVYKLTPLHMALREPFNIITPRLLQMFVEAGANISLKSSDDLTVMHDVVRNQDNKMFGDEMPENEAENIDYLASQGIDINVEDNLGCSPIFYSLLPETITHLINLGARVNQRNKFGQTALVFHVCLIGLRDWDVDPYNVDIFQALLNSGLDVDALDNYGSTILHYAAWQGLPLDIVQLILERGATIVRDTNGQLPCDIAFSQRTKELIEILCNCDSQCHQDDRTFFPDTNNETINDKELKDTAWVEIECLSNSRRRIKDKHFLLNLLRMPGIGAVCFADEAADIRSAVYELVQKICTGISESLDLFVCTLVQAGSVGENTKIGLPDEFDFVCILDRISQACCVENKHTPDEVGYANLVLRDDSKEQDIGRYFDRQEHLKTHLIWTQFRACLGEQLIKSNMISNPSMFYAGDSIKDSTHPTCQFSLMWMGSYYKCLKIDIDLVPAVHVRGWWPDGTHIQNLACDTEICKNDGFMLLIQTTMKNEDKPSSKLRISAQRAEKMHMSQLPQLARDAYMMSKVMCDRNICPSLDSVRVAAVNTYITSYMLKNCMFHVFHSNYKFRKSIFEDKYTADELQDFVIEIFRTLRDACSKENLASYIFPWQNIFTFAISHHKFGDDEDERSRCVYRSVFAKIILTILGQTEKLNDNEKDVLFEYESWFSIESSDTGDADWP